MDDELEHSPRSWLDDFTQQFSWCRLSAQASLFLNNYFLLGVVCQQYLKNVNQNLTKIFTLKFKINIGIWGKFWEKFLYRKMPCYDVKWLSFCFEFSSSWKWIFFKKWIIICAFKLQISEFLLHCNVRFQMDYCWFYDLNCAQLKFFPLLYVSSSTLWVIWRCSKICKKVQIGEVALYLPQRLKSKAFEKFFSNRAAWNVKWNKKISICWF